MRCVAASCGGLRCAVCFVWPPRYVAEVAGAVLSCCNCCLIMLQELSYHVAAVVAVVLSSCSCYLLMLQLLSDHLQELSCHVAAAVLPCSKTCLYMLQLLQLLSCPVAAAIFSCRTHCSCCLTMLLKLQLFYFHFSPFPSATPPNAFLTDACADRYWCACCSSCSCFWRRWEVF